MSEEKGYKMTKDLLPVPKEERNWTIYNYIALWIAMDIGIPTYYLASGLIAGGMSLAWAMFTILLGQIIIMIPIMLNGHAGTKYGLPAPIYWRSAFGYRGAILPAVVSAIVSAGWYGIQIWIGGSALNTIITVLAPGWANFAAGKWICFAIFWAFNLLILVFGMGFLRKFESIGAPFLLIWMVILLIWARTSAGSWGPLVSQKGTPTLAFFIPSLAANVAYWGPMALNVTNFTRYAKDQKTQMVGQFAGLPTGIFLLALVGSLVTSCTVVIFGEAIWDPVTLTGMVHSVPFVIGSMLFLMIATLTTNVAANAVSPATVIMQVSEGRINFKVAVTILSIIAIVIRPWRLLSDLSIYMDTFLNGGGAFLGPIAGVMIAHYFLISKTEINADAVYDREGEYKYEKFQKYTKIFACIEAVMGILILVWAFVGNQEFLAQASSLTVSKKTTMIAYAVICLLAALYTFARKNGGMNPLALFSVVASVCVIFAGMWIPGAQLLYDSAIIIGMILGVIIYYILMRALDGPYIEEKRKEHAQAKAAA